MAQPIDLKVHERLRSYLFQRGLATLSLVVILMFQEVRLRAAIVVAVASTAFIHLRFTRQRRGESQKSHR